MKNEENKVKKNDKRDDVGKKKINEWKRKE